MMQYQRNIRAERRFFANISAEIFLKNSTCGLENTIQRIVNKNRKIYGKKRGGSGVHYTNDMMLPYCYRGESSCHATRRYFGPEGDLYLHRCDITIVALKVTVMTPVHFRPAIRMVLTFSLPTETRAPGMSS